MKISIKMLKTRFFYFSYLTFFSFSIFGKIPILGEYLKFSTNFGILLLIFLFFIGIRKYKIEELCMFVVLFAYSFFMIYKTNYYGIFKLVFFIAASKGIDFRKCVKYDLIFRIIMTAIMFILFHKGIAPDVTSVYNNNIRHSIGFENVNHVGMMAFIMVIEMIYLYRAKFKILQYIIAGGILIIADLIAGSRTAELVTIISLILIISYNFFPKTYKKNSIKIILKYFPIICSLITLIGTYLFSIGNNSAIILNKILSGRFYNVLYYYKKYGFSLFGVNSLDAGRTLDNFYGYCYIVLGMVTFLIFVYFYVKLIDQLFINNKPAVIVLTSFIIYGLSERLWMNIDYNIMMLVFKNLIYHDLEKKKSYAIF